LGVEVTQERQQVDVARGIGTRTPADRLLVHLDELVEKIEVLDRTVCRRQGLRAVQAPGRLRRQDVQHQRTLARAAHTRDAGEQSDRKPCVDAAQVVRLRLSHGQPCAVRLLELGVTRHGHLPSKIRTRARLLRGKRHAGGGRALEQELPALPTSLRPELDDLVGDPHRVFVVLDHDHRVPAVAQGDQGIEELAIVVRVQADARLVQNVDHPDQPHAELCRETHALGLAAGQGAIVSFKRQVAQAGLEQEVQPLLDAVDHLAQRRIPTEGRAQLPGQALRRGDIQRHEIGKSPTGDPHRATAGIEAVTAAFRTGAAHHERREPRPESIAVGVAEAFLEVGDDAREGHRLGLTHAPQLERKLAIAGTVQQHAPRFLRQLAPGFLRIKWQLLGQLLQDRVVADDEVLAPDAPRLERAFPDRLVRVGDDQLRDKTQFAAEAVASRACTLTVTERKVPRSQLRENLPADLAGQRLAEIDLPPRILGFALREHDGAVAAFAERQFQGVGQATSLFGRGHQTIDHEVDLDLPRPRSRRNKPCVVERFDLTSDPHALEAALAQARKLLPQHARLGLEAGRKEHDAFSGALGEHALHVVIQRTAHHAPAISRAGLLARQGPQQLRVIGDLGRGGDGGAGATGAGALLDGEHR